MIYKGNAFFNGKNGSCEFEYGRGYDIKIKKKPRFGRYSKLPGKFIVTTQVGLFCPYSSMETLLQNWQLDL